MLELAFKNIITRAEGSTQKTYWVHSLVFKNIEKYSLMTLQAEKHNFSDGNAVEKSSYPNDRIQRA